METMYFDEGVRAAKRQQLQSSMLDVSNSFPNDQKITPDLRVFILDDFICYMLEEDHGQAQGLLLSLLKNQWFMTFCLVSYYFIYLSICSNHILVQTANISVLLVTKSLSRASKFLCTDAYIVLADIMF